MSYTKTVNFQAKDALASGNPSKIIKGTEIDDEFDAIQVADALNLKRDGTTTASADIPMGSHKFTGLAAGTTAGDSVRYEQFASPPAIGNTTPAAITGTTITASTQFSGPGTGLSGTASSLTSGTATNIAGGALGSVPYQSASGTTALLAAGSQGLAVVSGGAAAPVYAIPVLRGYIDGLTLSTAGASATMSIAAGVAADSSNVYVMNLSSAISKTTSAWAVGTASGGKLSAAAIANNTWYYWYLIRRTDTGVVDVGFDVSSTTPTMPTGYTQYRYIGAGLTDGSAQWTFFIQRGDKFTWGTPVLDMNNVTGAVTATLQTLTVPLGRKMEAFLNVSANEGGAYNGSYFSDPDTTDVAPGALLTANPQPSIGGAGTAAGFTTTSQVSVLTNTSAQIRHRETAAFLLAASTVAWIDLRGKNA